MTEIRRYEVDAWRDVLAVSPQARVIVAGADHLASLTLAGEEIVVSNVGGTDRDVGLWDSRFTLAGFSPSGGKVALNLREELPTFGPMAVSVLDIATMQGVCAIGSIL